MFSVNDVTLFNFAYQSLNRRIAAISNAKRVAHELDSQVGDRVGYAVRFESKLSSATQLKFVTDGVLLREIIDDKVLSKYDVVIVGMIVSCIMLNGHIYNFIYTLALGIEITSNAIDFQLFV
jgi:hypothetical protein